MKVGDLVRFKMPKKGFPILGVIIEKRLASTPWGSHIFVLVNDPRLQQGWYDDFDWHAIDEDGKVTLDANI